MEKEIANKECERYRKFGKPNSIIFVVLKWIKTFIFIAAIATILIASIVNSIKLDQLNEKIDNINFGQEKDYEDGVEIVDQGFYSEYEIKESKVPNDEEFFLYFHQESCEFCLKANKHIITYYVTPTAYDKDEYIFDEIPVYFVTPESSNELFEKYEIEGTPTMIHFKDGKDIERVVGDEEVYRLLDEVVSRFYKK